MLTTILSVVFYFLGMFESDTANRALNKLYPDPLTGAPIVRFFVLVGWPIVAVMLLVRLIYLHILDLLKPTDLDKHNEAVVDEDIKRLKAKIEYWNNYKKQRNESNGNN